MDNKPDTERRPVSQASTSLTFAADSAWAFFFRVLQNYWKRTSAMVGTTLVYTGVANFRLLAIGTLIAVLESRATRPATSPPGPLPDGAGLATSAPPQVQAESEMLSKVEALLGYVGFELDGTLVARVGDNQFLYDFLMYLAVAFAVAAVLMAVAFFCKEFLGQWIVLRAAVDVRKELFNHLTTQSVSYFNRQRSGDIISRLTNDLESVQGAFRFIFVSFLPELIKIVGFLALAAWLNWNLFCITVPFFVALLYPLMRAGRKVHKHGRGRQQKLGVVTEAINQLFSGIRIVKSFGMEHTEQEAFDAKNDNFIRSSLRVVRAKAKGRAIQEFLYNMCVAAFLVLGVWLLSQKVVSVAIMAAFIGALIQSYRPLRSISRAWFLFQESRAGVERILEVLREKPVIEDDPALPAFPGLQGTIRLEKVSFSYEQIEAEIRQTRGHVLTDGVRGNLLFTPAVRGVSFEVRVGQVTAFVGPSGAGKSTLVDLLARFYDPQQGRILVDGRDIREYRQSSYVRAIAMVSQDPFLFNTSILENIRYGRDGASDEEVIEAAKTADAHEFILEQPEGYDTIIGERGAKLSGGQRQRLTIARAVLKNAPILMLDEATSSLDSESEREVQAAMENLMRDRTTFIIAHRLSTVVHADQIVVFEDGRIVELGIHTDLLARRGKYRDLWAAQNPDWDGGSAAM